MASRGKTPTVKKPKENFKQRIKRGLAYAGIGAVVVYGSAKAVRAVNPDVNFERVKVVGPAVAGIERFGDRAVNKVSRKSRHLFRDVVVALAAGYTACKLAKKNVSLRDINSFKKAWNNAPEFVVGGGAGFIYPKISIALVGGYWIIKAIGPENVKKGFRVGIEKIKEIKNERAKK
ncbi:MAG: hypothetical protein ABIA76_05435 [Candidatus Diapherotrites archaeon]